MPTVVHPWVYVNEMSLIARNWEIVFTLPSLLPQWYTLRV